MGFDTAECDIMVCLLIRLKELGHKKVYIVFCFLRCMNLNLNENADEIAALAMIFAGLAVMMMSAIATLFFGATGDMGVAFKVVEGIMFLAAGYLFRGHAAKKANM